MLSSLLAVSLRAPDGPTGAHITHGDDEAWGGGLCHLPDAGSPSGVGPGAKAGLEAALINLGPPPMEADLSGEALRAGIPTAAPLTPGAGSFSGGGGCPVR